MVQFTRPNPGGPTVVLFSSGQIAMDDPCCCCLPCDDFCFDRDDTTVDFTWTAYGITGPDPCSAGASGTITDIPLTQVIDGQYFDQAVFQKVVVGYWTGPVGPEETVETYDLIVTLTFECLGKKWKAKVKFDAQDPGQPHEPLIFDTDWIEGGNAAGIDVSGVDPGFGICGATSVDLDITVQNNDCCRDETDDHCIDYEPGDPDTGACSDAP